MVLFFEGMIGWGKVLFNSWLFLVILFLPTFEIWYFDSFLIYCDVVFCLDKAFLLRNRDFLALHLCREILARLCCLRLFVCFHPRRCRQLLVLGCSGL